MLALFAFVAHAHTPVIRIAGPDEDWCQVFADAMAGDVVLLLPGDYQGPCALTGKEPVTVGEFTTLQSLDPLDPAVLHHGTGDYILHVDGYEVLLTDLDFTDVPPGAAAIEVGDGDRIWLRDNTVHDLDGDGIRTTGIVADLSVGNSTFTQIAGVAVGLGAGLNYEARDNLLTDVGDGIRADAGGCGTVSDNTLTASGVGIAVGGGLLRTEVSRNFIAADGLPLQVLSGPIVIRNNIGVGATAALTAEGDADIQVLGNSLVGEVTLRDWSGGGQQFRNNAVNGVVSEVTGALVDGNVDCTVASDCWYDAANWDFYPVPDTALRTAGVSIEDGDLLSDWCRRGRGTSPTVGALEAISLVGFGPITLVDRDLFSCTVPVDPEPTDTGGASVDTDLPSDTGAADVPRSRSPRERGCGCAQGGSAPGAAGPLLLLVALLRTRRRDGMVECAPEVD